MFFDGFKMYDHQGSIKVPKGYYKEDPPVTEAMQF